MDFNEMVERVVEEIVAMGPGASDTVAHIAAEVSGAGSREPDVDLFALGREVSKAVEAKGLYLDRSAYDDMVVGLPYNIPFVVRCAASDQEDLIA